MSRYYKLDKKGNVVPIEDFMEWANWFENSGEERRVALDEIKVNELHESVRVSTVFLSLDHSFSFNPNLEPLIYETMVFGGDQEDTDIQERYSTKAQALKGHAKVVKQLNKKYGSTPKNKL